MPPSRAEKASGTLQFGDPAFAALPASLRRRIDRAFDDALDSYVEYPRERRELSNKIPSGSSAQTSEPGGFIADDIWPGGFLPEGDVQPGGFVVDAAVPQDSAANTARRISENGDAGARIPLSFIPHALQLLDLQPDDEDVLAVFRHAASGWEDKGHITPHSRELDEQYVDRQDWRAVCAVLLGGDEGDEDFNPSRSGALDASDEGGELTPLESSNAEDEYEGSEPLGGSSEVSDDASDGEYEEGFIAERPRRKKGVGLVRARTSKWPSRRRAKSDDDDEPNHHRLTSRQRLECRRVFALFFPNVPDSQLHKQRIMINNINRVAKLLKEKITAEETVEMLEIFSSSADKSMSIQDFEQMMITAKLA
ncbi:hypothetical protein DAEQUDRAFT_680273 [Daedalea quercina L-15889]|uniref:EF-hand domain-containing protein n=1 Tax=Daedalea quercina L-15889 TaxID=1314783 RepID=A0A165KRT5_9APHY|nr:hypothetical protein DAEQUDRAFT_680273 [Daedalea quercina L-15889]